MGSPAREPTDPLVLGRAGFLVEQMMAPPSHKRHRR
jgi:hypothetical protein